MSAQGTATESSKQLSRSRLCVFLHPEEFQVSGLQLSCRGVAAGGQVHRAGLGAAGLGCLLGPDSGEFCPLQWSLAWGGLRRRAQAQPGVGTRPGVRQCPRAESAPFSRSVRGGSPPVHTGRTACAGSRPAEATRPAGGPAWAPFLSIPRLSLLASAPGPFCHCFCGFLGNLFLPQKPSVSPLASQQSTEARSLISL